MKISQEARDAALRLTGFDSEDDLIYWGRQSHHEKVAAIAAVMQSIINSTLERAAKVADALEVEMDAFYESGGEMHDSGMASASCCIALDIRKMMES